MLRGISYGKCWYSEACELYSYYHVDHFRPKNHYWWLAFDWKNYRLCGSVGNVIKRTSFPIQNEINRAIGPESAICDEICYLLDPTQIDDCSLLTFDESGHSLPAVPDGSWSFQRVDTTIKILELNYTPLIDGRKQVWQKCLRLVNQIQNLLEEQPPSVHTKTILQITINTLRSMIAEEAELSMTARACLVNASIVRNIKWPLNLL